MSCQSAARIGLGFLIAGVLAVPVSAWSQAPPAAAAQPRTAADPSEKNAQAQQDAEAARALTLAAFARPAAAPPPGGPVSRIIAEAEKEKAAAAPAPKPEWVSKEGLQVGGKGMQIKTPF